MGLEHVFCEKLISEEVSFNFRGIEREEAWPWAMPAPRPAGW